MKRLFFLIAVTAITTIAHAQFEFGIKAGLNIASNHFKSADFSTASKPGFNAGAIAIYKLEDPFSVQAELMYSGQGVKIKNPSGTFTLAENYINVPILFKFNHTSGLFAEVGPQIGFLVNAKYKGDGSSTSASSEYKAIDFAAVLGVGYLSSLNIGIDARYNFGFSNIEKATSEEGFAKNRVFQVGLFYMFGETKSKK